MNVNVSIMTQKEKLYNYIVESNAVEYWSLFPYNAWITYSHEHKWIIIVTMKYLIAVVRCGTAIPAKWTVSSGWRSSGGSWNGVPHSGFLTDPLQNIKQVEEIDCDRIIQHDYIYIVILVSIRSTSKRGCLGPVSWFTVHVDATHLTVGPAVTCHRVVGVDCVGRTPWSWSKKVCSNQGK